MPISNEHVKLLESYRDKAYITSILCAQSSEHFEFLRSIINIPLILSSSVMTVMNSMNESNSNEIKISNIVLNTWTSLILSLVGNFKLTEQATNFKQIEIKMNKLTHKIEVIYALSLYDSNSLTCSLEIGIFIYNIYYIKKMYIIFI